jgi:hypothetical protein
VERLANLEAMGGKVAFVERTIVKVGSRQSVVTNVRILEYGSAKILLPYKTRSHARLSENVQRPEDLFSYSGFVLLQILSASIFTVSCSRDNVFHHLLPPFLFLGQARLKSTPESHS